MIHVCVVTYQDPQHSSSAHSFMLGLRFNVWLGCWHITHMCFSHCQPVCLVTVKLVEVTRHFTSTVSPSLTHQRERPWYNYNTIRLCTIYLYNIFQHRTIVFCWFLASDGDLYYAADFWAWSWMYNMTLIFGLGFWCVILCWFLVLDDDVQF